MTDQLLVVAGWVVALGVLFVVGCFVADRNDLEDDQ